MRLEATDSVRQILRDASCLLASPSSSSREGGGEGGEAETRSEILKYANCASVPWHVVLGAVRAIRENDQKKDGGPWMQDVCRGARLIYPAPPKRERNPDLVKRLEGIKKELERKKYADMVQDIDPERKDYVYMSTYKDQLGLGLNVVVVMATLFGLGYFVGIAYGGDDESRAGANVLPLCLGLAGAFAGLLLETALFMVRFRSVKERRRTSKGGSESNKPTAKRKQSKLKES